MIFCAFDGITHTNIKIQTAFACIRAITNLVVLFLPTFFSYQIIAVISQIRGVWNIFYHKLELESRFEVA